jgi:hypothetical protein
MMRIEHLQSGILFPRAKAGCVTDVNRDLIGRDQSSRKAAAQIFHSTQFAWPTMPTICSLLRTEDAIYSCH